MTTPLHTTGKQIKPDHYAQPKGTSFNGPAIDPAVGQMQAALRDLGVVVHYSGLGWYEAWDERGLVRYRWRNVDELLRQVRGEMELPQMTTTEPEQGTVPEYANGKDHTPVKAERKRRSPDNSTRAWVEPGIYQITWPSGVVSYEVHATVDGKSKYGGRWPNVEAARKSRDQMLGERGIRLVRPGKNRVVLPESLLPIPDSNLEQTKPADSAQEELARLFGAAQAAEAAYAQARCTFEEAVRAREAAWAALDAFLEGQRGAHTNGEDSGHVQD